jgi:hypothetical protein
LIAERLTPCAITRFESTYLLHHAEIRNRWADSQKFDPIRQFLPL